MKKTIIFASLCLLFISAVIVYRSTIPAIPTTTNVLSLETETIAITQIITHDGNQQEKKAVDATGGQSALDVLSQSKNTTIKNTSLGKLVESIDGVTNGTDNKYWIYFVNGKEANVGASDYIVQQHDIIEWKFQAYEQ